MLTRAAFAVALGWLVTVADATPAAAQVTVDILNPSPDLPENDPIAIAVSVTSVSAVTSVEAQVGTKTAVLDLHQGNWFGYINMSGLARGQHQLVVTATNAAMQTGQATRTFMLDRTPAITITSPVDYALGLPEVRAKATCTDDGGPCQMTVGYLNGPLLAAGTGSIDTLIKPIDGTPRLEFVATDSTNRSSKVQRNVSIHSSTRLRSEQGFAGRILDIQADRALIFEDSASPAVVRIVDRTTNTSQIIWTAPASNHSTDRGFLTPAGALLVVFNPSSFGGLRELQEWRGGTLTLLGLVELESPRVKGQWAIYSPSTGQFPLMLRDLTTGANTVIDTDAGNERHDVTADGRVFYWDGTPSEIFRYEPGPPPTTTQLTSGAPEPSRFPVTDGVNVVFTRVATPPNPSPNPSIVLRTGDGTEILLASDVFTAFPGDAYRIANGWVAFLRKDSNGPMQAWLRAPDGTERKLSPAGGAYAIVGLSETGEVVFDTSAGPSFARRYLARTDGSIVELGLPMGRPFFIDNAWYIAIGGQLLAVDPTVPARSILSEGATGTFFTTDVAILNPHNTAVPVTIRYLRENAPELEETRTLPAMSRTTIHEDDIPGLEGTSVSTVVEAPGASPVVVERLMSWDESGYGGHLGTAVDRTRVRWFFAEGAQGFFYTFFLLANSGASEATVKLTFLIEQGTPVTRTVEVAPGTRKTLYAGDVADLINRSFATVIESDVPIVAERAMYFGESPLWLGGHGSAGVPEPAYRWLHSEGATGSLFDTFILLANPNPVDVTVNLTYTTDKNQVIPRTKIIPASSRLTINIEEEAPELVNTAVSTRVETVTWPIVSERAMYWGTTGSGWREAHNSFGVTESGARWGVAEGRSGGPRGYETYVLVSNPSPFSTSLRVTFIKEDGTVFVPAQPFDLAPESRLNIASGAFPELANSNFSTIVESPNTGISVESAIYWNADGVVWEGGGNTVATRLP
jgi:hypothetical protein